jgi:hypothetical protein
VPRAFCATAINCFLTNYNFSLTTIVGITINSVDNLESYLTAQEFSRYLTQALIARYGQMPSARQVADDLYALSQGTISLSPEAVRKWMRGKSMPRGNAFIVLEDWLSIRNFLPTAPRPLKGVSSAERL